MSVKPDLAQPVTLRTLLLVVLVAIGVSLTTGIGVAATVLERGATGAVGPQGPKGDEGPTGEWGPTGDRGPRGRVHRRGHEAQRGPLRRRTCGRPLSWTRTGWPMRRECQISARSSNPPPPWRMSS